MSLLGVRPRGRTLYFRLGMGSIQYRQLPFLAVGPHKRSVAGDDSFAGNGTPYAGLLTLSTGMILYSLLTVLPQVQHRIDVNQHAAISGSD